MMDKMQMIGNPRLLTNQVGYDSDPQKMMQLRQNQLQQNGQMGQGNKQGDMMFNFGPGGVGPEMYMKSGNNMQPGGGQQHAAQ